MPKKATPAKAAKVESKKKEPKKAAPQKLQAIKKPYSKSQLFEYIAENTELSKKKVGDVFELLDNIISAHLCKNGAGSFTLTGIAKFKTKNVPAIKAKKGRNPFTGEDIMIKARPACNAVKIRPLKKLKEKVA